VFLRDQGPTEIGVFGIAREGDPLLIEDVALVPQLCTAVTVKFDDSAVADFFDAQIDLGRRPDQFARIWIHTHPGDSAHPSPTDEKTFKRVFGRCDWAVMAILAKGGEKYARLRFSAGPGMGAPISVGIDWTVSFPGADPEVWISDYAATVRPREPFREIGIDPAGDLLVDLDRREKTTTGLDQPELWDAAAW
jgi:hypothetical protein